MRRLRRALWLSASVLAAVPGGVMAQAVLPQGGSVVQGDVSIGTPGTQSLTITQGSNSAVVNWQSFSIGSGARVDIHQPSTSSTMLNRVTGNTTSAIHGQLNANGTVHLVNPNGIFIGPNGTVNAGSFVASTLDISDEDFMAGRLQYRGLGTSATVHNAGRVTIGRDGYAALIGGRVRNDGIVTVPYGRVGFAAGEWVTLDVSGDQFLQVAIPSTGEDDGEALIDNAGTVSAEGGLIEMRAATARHAARHAINLSGVAEASSVAVRGGEIILGGGTGGAVTVSGRVSTGSRRQPTGPVVETSRRPQMRGGDVTITGNRIELAGADIDASGSDGGGTVRIGGDFAGQGDLLRADTLSDDATTLIRADALDTGDGGRIVLWSEVQTDVSGTLSTRGGDTSGDGGFVEVSSRQQLNFSGFADRRALNGAWGTLLLDPSDIIIDPGTGGEDTLEANLGAGDVTLTTVGGTGGNGDITINADVDWATGTTLRLVADDEGISSGTGGNIVLNGAINGSAGGLELDAQGTITTTAVGSVEVASFVLDNGAWVQVAAPLPAFSAGNFEVDFGGSFLRALGGTGDAGTPYLITDVFGLQGIDSVDGANWELANDIDASGTAGWSRPIGAVGFVPIFSFDGVLDGAGFAVTGLTVETFNGEGTDPAGLFDTITANGTVRDLDLVDVDINGSTSGGLAGFNFGLVENVRVSGTVQGSFDGVGGLAGVNGGTIRDSITDVTVNAVTNFDSFGDLGVGGFVGVNSSGLIERSHALGDVSVVNGDADVDIAVGGFAGVEEAESEALTILDSYARGDVSVTSTNGPGVDVDAGGFVGIIGGSIDRSYSTGSVTVTGDATSVAGGFAGLDLTDGTEGATNFWDVETSGLTFSAVGTALTTAQFQDTETFITLGEAQGWDFGTTWAPGDTGFYPENYTTSAVILATPDPLTVQYGLTGSTPTTGDIAGGPADFVFDEDGDTLDTDPVFAALSFSDETVGAQTFTLTTASLVSADGVTYRVVDRPGTAEVTPASLTILPDDQSRTYGDLFTFAGTEFTVAGTLFFMDSVDSVTLTSIGTDVTTGVGDFAILGSDAVGTGLENYTIVFDDAAAFTVTPAPLIITADDQSRLEGDPFEFGGTEFTVTGLVNEDSVDSALLSSEGADADAVAADSPFDIVVSEPEGEGLENYDITFVDGTFTVIAPSDPGEGEIENEIPIPPVFVGFPLPNPPDTIDDGDGTFGGTAGFSPDAAAAQETLARVDAISESLEIKADNCGQSSGDISRYLACLSDSLNEFADELDLLSADLPPGMQNVARIVQDARVKIDQARVRAQSRLAGATSDAERQAIRRDAVNEARSALAEASSEIRKSIALVRADDPELATIQRATVNRVAGAVDSVGIKLARVAEL
ncbi:filamentous hemagglutinin N-terminal domain-containing protein [uncultured Tateyamaria sp.]|uniref:two-partner secretion domain-containing protein n=1 Tax=uncultured Tateyamaria sp. TaxID=455651 RepID=UPI00260ECB6F|nr:filamentous hemagglutinin N-terminal domain-containing protein [uncultured Tateyamaria sp.]